MFCLETWSLIWGVYSSNKANSVLCVLCALSQYMFPKKNESSRCASFRYCVYFVEERQSAFTSLDHSDHSLKMAVWHALLLQGLWRFFPAQNEITNCLLIGGMVLNVTESGGSSNFEIVGSLTYLLLGGSSFKLLFTYLTILWLILYYLYLLLF